MDTFLKYFFTFTLIIGLAGCQNDSSKETTTQPSSAQSQSPPQSQQLGQMSQQPAPDIELSDKEADEFVEASMNMQKVQMQAQKMMVGIIKDQGLDVKTYQKIAQAKRGGQSGSTSDVSDEQMKKFNQATTAIRKKQANIQEKMIAAIEDAGMKKERYQKISMAARQDSEVQQKLRKKMQQKQGMQGAQGATPSH